MPVSLASGCIEMEIVARRGETSYLLETAPGIGRVLDLEQKVLFPEFNIQSIIARGYWESYTGSQDELANLLSQVCIEQADGLKTER